jgi:Tfp pilus assembly protein PilO
MAADNKSREKLLMIITAVAGGLWLLNLIVITPLTDTYHARAAKIAGLRKDIEQGTQLIRRESAIHDRWQNMQSNAFPANATASEGQLFHAFDQWAQDSGVTLASQKSQQKDTDEGYSTLEWRVDVTGNMQSISKFLFDSGSSKMALKVQSLELTSRDDTGKQLALGLQVSGLILSTNAEQ